MNFFTVLTKTGTQNIHAPLPLTAHIIFCLIATALYIAQYKRKELNYYIYLTIAVDLTLATQFFSQKYVIMALGVAEIILLVMAFVSQHNDKKQAKVLAEKKKQEEIMKQGEDDGFAMTSQASKISDVDFDDFDDEDE